MNTVNARLYVCGDCANKIKDLNIDDKEFDKGR